MFIKTPDRHRNIRLTFLGTCVRHFKRGVASCKLYFDNETCTFRVLYTEGTESFQQHWIPTHCTKSWLYTFIRSSKNLQEDSYKVTTPIPDWSKYFIEMIVKSRFKISCVQEPVKYKNAGGEVVYKYSHKKSAKVAFDFNL